MIRNEKSLIASILLGIAAFFTALICWGNSHREKLLREQHQRAVTHVQQVRDGPDTTRVELYQGYGEFVPPTNVRVISIKKSGKHSYTVTVEGSKQAIVDLLIEYYDLHGTHTE